MTDAAATRERLLKKSWGKLLLGLLSLIYGAAVSLRSLLYRAGILRSRRLKARVVSIGNLTVGGTGKTPAVLLAAATLKKHGTSIAILSRGYGGKGSGQDVTTLLDDREVPSAQECGDEPWMMHQTLMGQGIPILVAKNRSQAGELAVTFYHSEVIILDDGFQHLKLDRDLDIVLVNALQPFGDGHLLPLGFLREPRRALHRAGLIVLTHSDRAHKSRLESIEAEIKEINPRAPIVHASHKADFLMDLKTGKKSPPAELAGRKIVSFCGIAEPESFEASLLELDAKIAQKWRYPDHHPYAPREIKSLQHIRDGMPVVTTLKDFTRFPPGWADALDGEVYALGIKLHLSKGREAWISALASLVPPQ